MITFSTGAGAIQLIRPLTEVDHTLNRVETWLILIAGGGIAIAAGLGMVVARAALVPVRRLTATAETVTETGDLSQRIDASGRDEIARLADSFNAMLGALEESTRAQRAARRRRVARAAHAADEPAARTSRCSPATGTLPPGERERLLARRRRAARRDDDVDLGADRSRPRASSTSPSPRRCGSTCSRRTAVERARRNRPKVTFVDQSAGVDRCTACRRRIERASANLLDNAAKWSPPGSDVEVGVTTARSRCATTGRESTTEDLPVRLRPLLPRARRARAAGAPGSGSRSFARLRRRTAARSSPSTRKAAALVSC
jgi:two-component system sensor histidine kinase MprB